MGSLGRRELRRCAIELIDALSGLRLDELGSARTGEAEGPQCEATGEALKAEARRAIRSSKKASKSGRLIRTQYGALPYRFTKGGSLEVLLVTSRQSKRWIIPKGWPIKGLKPAPSAAREAYEEAGVQGLVGKKAIGTYVYEKQAEES
jgi:hypothetical protein